MKRFRLGRITLVLSFVGIFLLNLPYPAAANQQVNEDITFHWAFGALVGSDRDRRLISIEHDTVLKTGDQLKMLLELKKKCFAYLFYYSSQGEMYLLFPANQFAVDYDVNKKYYIPEGRLWFELDAHTGIETFYLIASTERLSKLENLYRKYTTLAQAKDRDEFAQKIIAEIKKSKAQHRKLTAAAERPLRLGGKLRGVIDKAKKLSYPDITEITVEISAPNFYSRTFTIDHR